MAPRIIVDRDKAYEYLSTHELLKTGSYYDEHGNCCLMGAFLLTHPALNRFPLRVELGITLRRLSGVDGSIQMWSDRPSTTKEDALALIKALPRRFAVRADD
jgi:hypothetical protein